MTGFTPASCLSNPHLQTIWPFVFRKAPVLNRQRERFNTPDGDFFDVDWYGNGDKGIVILLHGLTGCSSSYYILGFQQALEQEGYKTAAVNFRACSGEPNLKAGSYHAGFTQDLQQLYTAIREELPNTPISTIGFSLGGNIMLKWLSEQADSLDIKISVAVSVPYKLANCADRVDTGFSRIYRKHLIDAMKSKLANKLAFFRDNDLPDEAEKIQALGDLGFIKSFWEFDHYVVAALHGFDDVHDYYNKNSSIGFLKDIKTKTRLIHSLDDPFMTPDVLPQQGELSSSIELLTTANGGHVGFVGQTGYWLEKQVISYLY
ncbi:MAG: hypothetical protein A6F71_08715 [Cycloclasticus sp. symbiont of Poecilosclerida sp. M]|nr:MAG: hypothetical protein A6F71_08715 [Cycloclasticus sp. symbiont of Poecilosclerida sp. M]